MPNKLKKPGCPPDISTITIGGICCRLMGKMRMCCHQRTRHLIFFSPHQLGVACPYGVEKIIHGLGICVEDYGNDDDLLMKIDLWNAFNLVYHQALLDECKANFSELFQWAAWCYGDHPLLLSAMGTLSSR